MNNLSFKIFALIFSLLFSITANASDLEQIKYPNLKDHSKLSFINGIWTTNVNKKNKNYIFGFYLSHSTTQNLAKLDHKGIKKNLKKRKIREEKRKET